MPILQKRKFDFFEFLKKTGIDSQKPLVLTHRGYGKYAEIPENTMEAFDASTKLGFSGHELDVRLTKDNVVVIIHGPDLRKTTNGKGLIENTTFEDIRKLDASFYLGKIGGKRYEIPTLEEYIQKLGIKIFTDIEIKKPWYLTSRVLEEEVIELVLKYNLQNRIIVTSFNIGSIRYIRQKYPQILTGIITSKNPRSLFWIPVGVFWAKPDIVVLHRGLLTKNWVKFVHSRNCGFATWGANREDDFKQYVKMGIDIIITDNMNFSSIEAVFASCPVNPRD